MSTPQSSIEPAHLQSEPDTCCAIAPTMAAAAESQFAGMIDAPQLPADWAEPLIQLQKLAAMGTMAAMLAHEFNNILTRTVNYAEHAQAHQDDGELVRNSLGKIVENCAKAGQICRSLFDFAGKSDERRRPVGLAKLVADAISCLGRDPAQDNIAIRFRVAPDLTVLADGTMLEQVFYNLILNARQAILSCGKRGGRITVSADFDEAGRVVCRVADTGCGIPANALPHIFTPFYSTKSKSAKADRKGIGLGLAICKSIIANHGGTLDVASTVGQGTAFTITLPGN
jgi:signal transduction histidine kinase